MILLLLVALVLTHSPLKASTPLSLNQYLEAVKSANKNYQAAEKTSESGNLRQDEGDLITGTRLILSGAKSEDKTEKAVPAFQGEKTEALSYGLGLSKMTSFGLNASVSYSFTNTTVTGANPQFFSSPTFTETKTQVELTQSLWRNGFGSETRAMTTAADSAAKASHYQGEFLKKSMIAQAEGAYWKLAMAKALEQVQSDSLDRARRMRRWAENRLKNQLADKSDFLQADSAFRLREFEFQQAVSEVKNASRQFNLLRGVDSLVVTEKLDPLPEKPTAQIKRAKFRADILAQEHAKNAGVAQARIGEEKARPTLDAFLNYSLNGRDENRNEAISESFKTKNPVTTFGVKFVMPIDFITMNEIKQGYRQEAMASQMKYEYAVMEQEKQWRDLSVQLADAENRLNTAKQFELAQKTKYEYEKQRHGRGRSTTFMVLQFEQEYALAQVNRLKVQTEILGLLAQMKTFEGDDNSESR